MKSARVQDEAFCESPGDADFVLLGTPTIYVGGGMAARVDDPTRHLGKVSAGFERVKIGGPTARVRVLADGRLEVTWGGVVIRGCPEDVATFTKMLNEDLTATNAGRRTLAKVVTDTSRRPFLCSVGRRQDKIYVDGMVDGLPVDLDDLEQLPRVPSAQHPNEITRGEFLSHFLAERDEYAHQGYTTFGRAEFDHVHNHGQVEQNLVRRELNQSPIVRQNYQEHPDGSVSTLFTYADGTTTLMDIDASGALTRVVKP